MIRVALDSAQEIPVNRVLTLNIIDSLAVARALSTQMRLDMFLQLLERPMNVGEVAEKFGIPVSTAASNINRLEDAGLILTEMVPGSRGTQKLCATVISRIVIDTVVPPETRADSIDIAMPIGQFVDCRVVPTCGLVGSNGIIGELDDPGAFYEPERAQAQLLWFRSGYVEYRFPKRIRSWEALESLELSMEICSEAPLYNANWPSDITLWINQVEVGTWTSPGDFGGEKGYLTPDWWGIHQTQFGLLKTWKVTRAGSYIDGRMLSEVHLEDLHLDSFPFVTVRIGVKPDAVNEGGMNLFGKGFGNYPADLVMRLLVREPLHATADSTVDIGLLPKPEHTTDDSRERVDRTSS
jgi:predicted transcriptional regulator